MIEWKPQKPSSCSRDPSCGIRLGINPIDASSRLGRTFINYPDENGGTKRAKIDKIESTGKFMPEGKQNLFQVQSKVGEKVFENVMTYNKIVEWCDQDLDKDDFFKTSF